MDPQVSTTPFGRRPMTLAMVASQVIAQERPLEAVVHKWQIFRTICEAKAAIGVSDRSLAVLNALLTFHPETVLTGDDEPVVFPSNTQLSLRAHGMPELTVRRHLAALVDCGLVIRRDSPNGKRFARRGEGGQVENAFGFDLSPLVARAAEFEQFAREAQAERRALTLARERITLHRRDIAKMIAAGVEESVPADWAAYHRAYAGIAGRIPRTGTCAELAAIADDLATLAGEIRIVLETHVKKQKASGNAASNERHIQNSNPDPLEFEPGSAKEPGATVAPQSEKTKAPQRSYPLGMVLDACPDIVMYAREGIKSWRDLMATAGLVRSMLGISPSAWEEAQSVLGEEGAAVVVAAILQKGEEIKSAGGYLRSLTEKARAGAFSLGPMLMALLRAKLAPDRKRAS